jgi:nucleotide-binding universal stress UspA family protein
VFASVLVALSAQAEGRDALVLGGQLVDADGSLVVGQVITTASAPLAGGPQAGARQREHAGGEVYATLGPDPRARYVRLSGLPFADAIGTLARRTSPDAIVVGQSLLGREPGMRRLLREAPCPIAVAPYGHRFVRGFRPDDVLVVTAANEEELRHALRPTLVVGDRPPAAIIGALGGR